MKYFFDFKRPYRIKKGIPTPILQFLGMSGFLLFGMGCFQNRAPNKAVSPQENAIYSMGHLFPYDSVVAYDYRGEDRQDGGGRIWEKGGLHPSVRQRQVLTQPQIEDLVQRLGESTTYGGRHAMCFTPHLGVVFYAPKKPVHHVSICLECNLLESSIPIPAERAQSATNGFSKNGRMFLKQFCKSLHFYVNEEESPFDKPD
jgi:hypothetical protein